MTTQKSVFNTLRLLLFFGLLALLGFAIVYILTPFLYPIFWAAVIAVMFYPVYTWFKEGTGLPQVSSFITILLVIVTLFLPLVLMSVLIINESIDLYTQTSKGDISENISQTTAWLESTPLGPYIQELEGKWSGFASDAGKYVASFLFENVTSFTQNSIRLLIMFFLMLYTLFYFFIDGPAMLERVKHLSPLGNKYEEVLYTRFTSTVRAALKSTIIIGGVQGVLGGILFWVTGVPSPFIWGVIMVIVAIIPALGPSILLVPACIAQFLLGNVWQGVALLIGTGFIGIVDNLIRPPLIGRDIEMHPLVVLFATLGGLVLFGVSGFVIGPIIAALFFSALGMYEIYYKKELDGD